MPDGDRQAARASSRVRARRTQLGLSLVELSWMTGITEKTLQRYESGQVANPRVRELLALACPLDILIEPHWRPPPARPRRQDVA